MQCQVDVYGERNDSLFVQFDTDTGEADLGMRVFQGKIGEFRFEWLVQSMDATEVWSLIQALLFAADHMPSESDMDCPECVAEQAKAKGGKS